MATALLYNINLMLHKGHLPESRGNKSVLPSRERKVFSEFSPSTTYSLYKLKDVNINHLYIIFVQLAF